MANEKKQNKYTFDSKKSKVDADRIWELYYRGEPAFKIAEILGITEYDVIKVLQPNGY